MKRCSSVVWRFFERIESNNRCVAVLCKLCETQYKYFGNTTNLRVHLTNKHPIQWDLSQNGTLDETNFRIEDDDTIQSPPKVKKYSRGYNKKKVRYSVSVDNEDAAGTIPKIEIQRVDVLENNSETEDPDEEHKATINMVRQMHTERGSDEEWLEEDPYHITHVETYEPKRKKMKYKKIKREIQSPPGLPGFYVAPKEKVVYEDSNRKDEYSVFGEYVANKLRKVKAPRTRGNLQQLITTILWQAEYGMYDNADAVKRVLMYSIHAPEPEVDSGSVPQEYTEVVHVAGEVIEQRDDEDQSGHGESIEAMN